MKQAKLPDQMLRSPEPSRISDDFAGAIAGMVDRPFLKSQKFEAQQLRAVRDGAYPPMRTFERMLVQRLGKLGIPMFCHEFWRDNAKQTELYVTGFSKAKAGQSSHNYGLGFDLIHSTKAWDLTEKQWQVIGHVGNELAKSISLPVVWGGDDPGIDDEFDWDPAHWQHSKWTTLKDDSPWPEILPKKKPAKSA